MHFSTPLKKGIFIKRYKRFFADVRLLAPETEGEGKTKESDSIVVAHLPNTGSLKSCSEPGSLCWVSSSSDPKRKLKYTLEVIQAPSGALVGVNTQWPIRLVEEAFRSHWIPEWKSYQSLTREVKINKETRLDICLEKESQSSRSSTFQHFIEIKNVTMAIGTPSELSQKKGTALFPDAVTLRGQKHLRELMRLASASDQDQSAELLFVIQREDCDRWSPADEIDPIYGQLIRKAIDVGVIISPYTVKIRLDPEGEGREELGSLTLVPQKLPVVLD